jgi:hypothetical protein
MIAIILIALVAGSASALMFTSIASGVLASLLLVYLAPLPLMVAAIAWGPLCGSLAGLAAALGMGAVLGLPYGIAFAVTVALPAWWLGHLVLLGRPLHSATGADAGVEWYPVGRILLWISGFAALTTMAGLFTIGTDADAITGALAQAFLRAAAIEPDALTADMKWMIDLAAGIAPPVGAGFAMLTLTLNLWLAAKVTETSGRLRRPWPDLKSAALPPMALVALCVATAFCFAGGLTAIIAGMVTACLMVAYALTGFAVLHTLTLALKARAFWLGSTYAIVAMFVWPIVAVIALGLADAAFGLRARFLRSRPPPLPSP